MVYRAAMDITPDTLSVLRLLMDAVVANATSKGFRDPPAGISYDLWQSESFTALRAAVFSANQHGEASEFWEAARKGALHKACDKAEKMTAMGLPTLTNAEEEIADEIIRALDKAQFFGVDPAKAVAVKHAFNTGRPFRHGDKLL